MTKYRKFGIALAGAAVAIVGRHFGLDSELYADAVAIATALGVVIVPNATTATPADPDVTSAINELARRVDGTP